MPFTANIEDVAYGAKGDGSTNDRPAFLAFQAAAQGLDSVLTLRSGASYYMGPDANADQDYIFSGIPSLVVTTTGAGRATLTDAGSDNNFHLGSRMAFPDGSGPPVNDGALIETVYAVADASSITLRTGSDHTKWTVGDWAMLGGFQMQDGGFPINPHFFEFVQVASKQTSVLPYTITFTAPLKNTYKSTWPNWPANGTQYGPSMLYVLDQRWDCAHDYRNLIIDKTGVNNPFGPLRKSTNCSGRSIVLTNVKPTNFDGINPSVNVSHTLINCDYTAVTLEVDKCITAIEFNACQMGSVNFQSSSVDLLTVSNGTTFAGSLLGTPKKTVIDSSTTSTIFPGQMTYGTPNEMVLSNSAIGGGIALGGHTYDGYNPNLGGGFGVDNLLNTMSAGVIAIPKSYSANAVNWAIPGSWSMWRDQDRPCIRIFRILDVWDDATYVYIQTSESGTWPSYNASNGGLLKITTHPCPRYTESNCTGGVGSGHPAGAPLYSYGNLTFDGSSQNGPSAYMWGKLKSLKVDVLRAYSGTLSLSCGPIGDGSSGTCYLTLADGSLSRYGPTVDAKNTGGGVPRTMISTGGVIATSGVQAGDSFGIGPDGANVPMFFSNISTMFMVRDISGESAGLRPSISMEMITDQGILPVAVAPLRLRLHA